MKKPSIADKLSPNTGGFKPSLKAYPVFLYGVAVLVLFLFSWLVRVNLAVPLFLLCLVGYMKFLRRELEHSLNLLNVSFLFVIIVAASYGVLANELPVFLIPFALVAMLSALLFNDRIITFILTVASAVTVAYFTPEPRHVGLLFLTSGLLSGVIVFDARRRNTIINTGVIVGVIQSVTYGLIMHFHFAHPDQLLTFGLLFVNGAATGIVVLGVLPIFEYLFGTITNIKLLELADFNNPILNRLMLEAPGTYHHSLVVGNLAEAGCKAVGANALLARIGAYYHDIGKLSKPEYFTENQGLTGNVHETLAPSMSRLVIMNHVHEGVELAKKYKLNKRLVDFVQQHHGRSLVYYFYRRALENTGEPEEIAEEGFRYPGPKPSTKETAIVLLADSVEAATRTLKEPTPGHLEETVHKIINNKFIDGQLDECDLTLKDLEIIAQVFVHILSGMYHSRVDYSEAAREHIHTKSANNNSRHAQEGPGTHS